MPNPVDIIVGRNIRIHRLHAKMSQEALADKIGVTFQQVQKYEKGTNRVGASRLTMIANVLHSPITIFFEGVASDARRNDPKTPSPNELLAEPHALRLVEAFARIDDIKVRRALVDLAEALNQPPDRTGMGK